MRVTLVVPQLLAAPSDALSALHAFKRLATYAGTAETLRHGLDTAVLVAAGLPENTPLAPLAARGAGFDPGASYVLRADPVELIAGRDDVLLGGRIDDVAIADAHALVHTLNAHFAQDGLTFHAPRGDAWFVTAQAHVPIDTTPLADVHGPLHPHLPRGAHAAPWRRWWSEMQMLLHAHPVNEAREAAGRPVVTAVWLAGGGVASPVASSVSMYATPGAAGDIARGIAAEKTSATPATFAALPRGPDTLVVLPPATGAGVFAQDWLEPALAALAHGSLSQLTVVADGDGRTLQWRAAAPSFWQRVRMRIKGTPALFPPRDA